MMKLREKKTTLEIGDDESVNKKGMMRMDSEEEAQEEVDDDDEIEEEKEDWIASQTRQRAKQGNYKNMWSRDGVIS